MFTRRFSISFCATAALASFAATPARAIQDWQQLGPTQSPPPRSEMAMTYDPVSDRTLMFGGVDSAGVRNDTWAFDGQTWTQLTPSTSPPARAASSMSFDAVSQRVVLFGGVGATQLLGDTWLWNGANSTWTQATPAQHPVAVSGPMTFTDPLNGHVDCFGGRALMFYQSATWQWSGTNWVNLNPSTTPFARASAVVATDQLHHETVLFGGSGSLNPWNTWLWNGVDWSLQSPTNQPPLRHDSAGAYDPILQTVLMFGGDDGSVNGLNDTWRWTGSDWEELMPVTSPTQRDSFGMVYDPNVHTVIVFGGTDFSGDVNDTWSFVEPPNVAAYCTAGTTTHNCVPAISGVGTPSASAGSGFTIHVANVEGQKQGLLFYGIDNSGFAPLPWGTSTSFLCVKSPTQRTPVQSSGGTVNACDGSLALDWNAFMAANPSALGNPIGAGQAVYAQGWFRDPGSPKTTMLSNALQFGVGP
jgi:hypothetical protein